MAEQDCHVVYEFGPFVLDPDRRQLRRGPRPVKLYPKEFDTLLALVERSGQVVTKDELLRQVWPDAVVEEGNLTTHVSHLRKVLGGDGGKRDYIVTVPGRGYRFVGAVRQLSRAGANAAGAVETTNDAPDAATPITGRSAQSPAHGIWRHRLSITLLTLAGALITVVMLSRSLSENRSPSFHQLTFRRGTIWSARFAPDGQTVVYGAAWDGKPIQLFSTRAGSPESRFLGQDADVLSVSSSGEMAISSGRRFARLWESSGTLARLSLDGSAPRDLLQNVKDADWSPDGTSLAVVRRVKGHDRLEFPMGQLVYETEGFLICPRVSKTGDAVAFLERRRGDESVELIDRAGQKTTLASGQHEETGLAWSADGDELLFTVVSGGSTGIHAVTRSGQQRMVTQAAGEWKLHDIARDGRALLTQDHKRGQIVGLPPGESRERDLSWLDRSVAVDLSPDGRLLLLAEVGAGGGRAKAVYLRKTDGSPAVRLGEGEPETLSPDGKWALVNQSFAPERLVLLPTGPGEPRTLDNASITDYYRAKWLPDGTHIVFGAIEPGHDLRAYVQDVNGGVPRPLSSRGAGPGAVFLPDGTTYVARAAPGEFFLFNTKGGDPRPVRGLVEGDHVIQASSDGGALFVLQGEGALGSVDRLELSTGRRERWKEIAIPDPAGVMHAGPEFPAFLVTPDGTSYVYNYLRVLSDLYIVDGLK